MTILRLTGGFRLDGTVPCSGSKNAALPMMAAAILADRPVRLQHVPHLTDVETLILVLRRLGMEATRTAEDDLLLTPDDTSTNDPAPVRAPYNLVRRMRAGFCVLGPLLARRRKAIVSLPGGCNIGDRPVDIHLRALAAMGADIRLQKGYVIATAKRLIGAEIDLAGPRGPTVTGTANLLCAAVLARGTTTFTSAAREPEICCLGDMLNAMGARITGLGTSTLRIAGVDQLDGVTFRVIPDRIEAATLLLAVAITGGSATVTNVDTNHLDAVLDALRMVGYQLHTGSDFITIESGRSAPGNPINLIAGPYPGLPTDIQAQLTALLSVLPGRATICDEVFPDRFLHVAELNRLGARIERHDATAIIEGVSHLCGATVVAPDLRAGAAMVLAGLAAQGETTVRRVHLLDRGYQRLDEKLNALGARITRV